MVFLNGLNGPGSWVWAELGFWAGFLSGKKSPFIRLIGPAHLRANGPAHGLNGPAHGLMG